jgi:hypothetical protein
LRINNRVFAIAVAGEVAQRRVGPAAGDEKSDGRPDVDGPLRSLGEHEHRIGGRHRNEHPQHGSFQEVLR